MILHAVRSADNQYGCIQHLKCALGLGRKVNVTRRVEQCEEAVPMSEYSLLGKDGDAATALLLVVVQKGVSVIDASRFS